MRNCYLCGVAEEKVKIFDAINELRSINLCERCSIIENIPIIKKPTSNQIKESETTRVSERMRALTRIREARKSDTFLKRDRLKELEKNPELERPEKENLDLSDYFHWEIMKNRRRRGWSQKQLANYIGESEVSIKMIENKNIPENAKKIIIKIEQLFHINLRKKSMSNIKNQPILVTNDGKLLDLIPEEEMIFIDEEPRQEISKKTAEEISLERARKIINIKEDDKNLVFHTNKDLDIRKLDKGRTTIGDLQKLHEKKLVILEKERFEEKRKIEERQRILRESREKDRKRIEQEKNLRILEKEKEEETRRKIIEQKKREVRDLREKEEKEVNKYLGGSELLEEDNKDF
ncbi:MAG: helix-turn-helix domain-containing protein [Nanoarchaeota archaeon]